MSEYESLAAQLTAVARSVEGVTGMYRPRRLGRVVDSVVQADATSDAEIDVEIEQQAETLDVRVCIGVSSTRSAADTLRDVDRALREHLFAATSGAHVILRVQVCSIG